jgi:polyhydroxybutyrate depolymerase
LLRVVALLLGLAGLAGLAAAQVPAEVAEPLSRAELAVSLAAAMRGLLTESAVEALDAALEAAPRDYVPPGTRDRIVLLHQGVNRTYTLYTPTTYNPNTPTPLLLGIHPRGTTPFIFAAWTAFDYVAEEHGFVIAYPRGTDQDFYAGPVCCGNSSRDDLGLMRRIVDDVKTRRNIDARRVYSTGQSNGGFMSHRLACDASDILAATGLSAGSSPWVDHEANCRPVRPVPILAFHGRRDTLVPYAGMLATMANWRVLNRCSETSSISYQNGVTTCEAWADCALQRNGVPTNITICTAEGVGHYYWPGTWVPLFPTGDVNGSREIWRFVSQYTL